MASKNAVANHSVPTYLYGMIFDVVDKQDQHHLYVCDATVWLCGKSAKGKLPEITNTNLSDQHSDNNHIRFQTIADLVKEHYTYTNATRGILIFCEGEVEFDVSKVPSLQCPVIALARNHCNIVLGFMKNANCLRCTLLPGRTDKQHAEKARPLTGQENGNPPLISVSHTESHEKLKSAMFDDTGKLQCMTAKKSAFDNVFMILNEEQYKDDELRDVLGEILGHFWEKSGLELFEVDFVFYVILCHRLIIMVTDSNKCIPINVRKFISLFIGQCQQWLEDHLNVDALTQGVRSFIQIEGSERWRSIISIEGVPTAVLSELSEACLQCFTRKWSWYQQKEKFRLNLHLMVCYVKAAMKWIAIAIKVCPRQTRHINPSLWNEHITSVIMELSPEVLKAVAEGIKFSEKIELCQDAQFGAQSILKLLNPGHLRPLGELRNAVVEFKEWMQPELVTKLRMSLEDVIKSSVSARTKMTVYDWSEVFDLLHSLQTIPGMQEHEMNKWVSFLLRFVDFSKEKCVKHVKMIMEESREGHLLRYKSHTERELLRTLGSEMLSLDLHTFVQLNTVEDILPPSFIETFLAKLSVPKCSRLTDESWKLLMGDIARRFPGASNHQFFVKTLKKIGHSYTKKQEFISDLFLVEASLFNKHIEDDVAVQVQLKEDLMHYIQRWQLCDKLLECHPWDVLASKESVSDLQAILLEVVAQEMVPQTLDALEKPSPHLQEALKSAVQYLCTIETIIEALGNPSHYQVFCWQLIGTVSTRLSDANPSLKWISRFSAILSSISQVYVNAKFKVSACSAISPHPWALIYFECVDRMIAILERWKTLLNEKRLNYQELMDYLHNHNSSETVATCYGVQEMVSSESTLTTLKLNFESAYHQLCSFLMCQDVNTEEWQSITTVLCDYDVRFSEELMKYVAFPGDKVTDDFKNHQIPLINFPVKLQLSQSLTLAMLEELIENLATFLGPLHSPVQHLYQQVTFRDFLLYFHTTRSMLFKSYIKMEQSTNLPGYHEETSWLKNALVVVFKKFRKILNGTAIFSDIPPALVSLPIIRAEIQLLVSFEGFSSDQSYTNPSHLENMFFLDCVLPDVKGLIKVCDMYEELQAFSGAAVQKLRDVVLALEDTSILQLRKATQRLGVVKENLPLERGEWEYLTICHALKDSSELHSFLAENGFLGELGRDNFEQKYRLVTQQLQGEEYPQDVLNQLYIVYSFIGPLFNQRQTFDEFIGKLSSMNPAMVLPRLNTVNRNLNLIRFWYSRTDEDTVEKVSSDLRHILSTGVYKITTTAGNLDEKVILEFKPKDEEDTKLSWNHQEVEDFVCKLGFLDLKKEEDNISTFLFFKKGSVKLLRLFEELQELGYQQNPIPYMLCCNSTREDVYQKMERFQNDLIKISEEAKILKDDFKWLLLFSSQKLKKLAELLKQLHPQSGGDTSMIQREILKQISFVFPESLSRINSLSQPIQRLFAVFSASSKDLWGKPPNKWVEAFLRHLFDLLEERLALPNASQAYPHSAHSNAFLHKIQGSSPHNVVKTILSIFRQLPHSFQLLRCESTTTEQEVQCFFERIMKFPGQYVFVEVNCLSSQLEEAALKLYMINIPKIEGTGTQVHFIQTAPSLFEQAPRLDDPLPVITEEEIKTICRHSGRDRQVQIVYGLAGNGKTHYIKEQLQTFRSHQTVAVNEAFSIQGTIKRLNGLPDGQCAIHFNFTLVPPKQTEDERDRIHSRELMKKIGWFMFDFIAVGYVEDATTGASYTLPGRCQLNVFIEVSSKAAQRGDREDPKMSLQYFLECIPICKYLCKFKLIDNSSHPYTVDADVQLVAKYLRALETGMIDKLFTDHPRLAARRKMCTREPVKFGNGPNLPVEECHHLLDRYMSDHVKERKISQKLFIRYMKRRCEFLEIFPGFNYNVGRDAHSDKTKMGSTLVNAMLKEVTKLCDPKTKEDWSSEPHQQLIYEVQGGGGSIGWICLYPDQVSMAEKLSFQKLEIEVKTMMELFKRETLVHYLTRALSIPLTAEEDGLSRLIDESKYVLTLDYTLKMLNINECFECGVPVIIEGETGVGKTALLEMLSKLWNYGWLVQWKKRLQELAFNLTGIKYDTTEKLLVAFEQEQAEKAKDFLLKIKQSPLIAVLRPNECSFHEFWLKLESVDHQMDAECMSTLRIVLTANVSTFHKLDVHARLQPADLRCFFSDVLCQAKKLQECSETSPSQTPKVTAYLDEINTSSCAGLFKEILVDRSIDGEPIPDNVFLVAACNPLRGISLVGNAKLWHKPTYYVQQLHPTLEYLKHDYGALNDIQESEYVNVKMRMINSDSAGEEVTALSTLILESQKHVREYSRKELVKIVPNDKAVRLSRSAVSQRDMQRVFIFYSWLLKTYKALNRCGKDEAQKAQAVLVALGLVYYMRLNEEHRNEYAQFLDKASVNLKIGDVNFTDAFKQELDWYAGELEIPQTIAMTNALKENLLANIACCETRIPLIIIGEPGTSKTLSFNLAMENLNGNESKSETFRRDVFPALDPIFYQCSHLTTSNEVDKVFSSAIQRQNNYSEAHLSIHCVVFLDEAGLPEERHESLKVLHYHLDRREVSFVAITNYALDAAKTNRAITLYRPQTSAEDLMTVAKTSAVDILDRHEEMIVNGLCDSFSNLVKFRNQSIGKEDNRNIPFGRFYGQRDFIHLISYIRRNRGQGRITDKLVLEAIERNLNGHEDFHMVLKLFFTDPQRQPQQIGQQSSLKILRDSLQDHPEAISQGHAESSVRYKLIIDSSDDESAVRLLFTHGVLKKKNTRMFVCSEFPDESHMHINVIAGIKHSAGEGHTVLMCQTDEIHECFYELFNQRFRVIQDPEKGTLLYTNISIRAYSKPCRVDPNFQCFVVIKKSDLRNTPPPFLNRFEKYSLSYSSVFDAMCSSLPPILSRTMRKVHRKVLEFINILDQEVSLYGYSKWFEKGKNVTCHETLYSLMLSLLPPLSHQYNKEAEITVVPCETIELTLLATSVQALISNAGLRLPQHKTDDLQGDSEELFATLSNNEDYQSAFTSMNVEYTEQVVRTALEDLHSPHCELATTSKVSRLIIGLMSQWLVRYLVKRALQLLTPEALLKYHSKIPHSYISAFLDSEQHFSLKAVVENQLKKLDINHWDMSLCANKLVCYTRSSQYLLDLPLSFTPLNPANLNLEDQVQLEEVVYSRKDELMVLTVSTNLLESALKKQLEMFVSSESLKVLLIMCNMRDISKTMINHLRILIEQQEDTNQTERKLFVLLLHFPPKMFFNSCYQALFLTGWDHFYIDLKFSNTFSKEKTVTSNVRQCFQHCLSVGLQETSTSPLILSSLLVKIIPAVSSRIVVGHPEQAPFNKKMNLKTRGRYIESLFFSLKSGDILIALFEKYWNPSRLKKVFEEAVNFTFSCESTLSITTYVNTQLQEHFTDFIVCMMAAMNEGCTLDIVLGECSQSTLELFLDFIPLLDRPMFADLHQRSMDILRPDNKGFKFPFFLRVYDSIEQLVDECQAEVGAMMEGTAQHSMEERLYEKMRTKLQEIVQACNSWMDLSQRDKVLGTVMKVMCRSSELKNLYFNDFAHYNLRVQFAETMTHNTTILDAYFTWIPSPSEDISHSLVSWLARIHTHPVDMQWIIAMTKVEALVINSELRSNSETDLANCAITTIHHSLTNLMHSESTTIAQFHDWEEAYQSVVQVPSLYGAMQKLSGESRDKLNLAHITFLSLHTHHFMDALVVKELFHKLEDTTPLTLRYSAPTCIQLLKPHLAKDLLQFFLEQLLSHYLYSDDGFSDPEDCKWICKDGLDTHNDLSMIHFISPSLYKHYLTKLLGSSTEIESSFDPSFHFNPDRRQQIGEVLAESNIQEMTICLPETCKSLLQGHDPKPQWLVRLYLLVTMENLEAYHCSEVDHAKMAALNSLSKKLEETPCEWERPLLVIEKEVALQKLLNIFAKGLCDAEKTAEMVRHGFIDDINCVVSKERSAEQSGLHLCFYLWKHLNSITQFRRILTDKQSTIYTRVHCLKEYCRMVPGPSEESHRMLINPRDRGCEVAKVYREVCIKMQEVCDSDQVSLVGLAQKFGSQGEVVIDFKLGSAPLKISKWNAFRMCLWLCAFFEFYDKQASSHRLAEDLRKLQGQLSIEVVQLLCCFVNQSEMISQDEDGAGLVHQISGTRTMSDPLYQFFTKFNECGSEERQIRQTLANMVAVILGCEDKKCHLWYHLFDPKKLAGTYLTGYLYDRPLGNGYYYDCGVMLSADGELQYNSGYRRRATKKIIELNALYSLIMVNYGAFCLHLLTQRGRRDTLRGNVLSYDLPIRHHCIAELNKLWLHSKVKLGLSPEQISLLIIRTMQRLMQACCHHNSDGIFRRGQARDDYERMWNNEVFKPSLVESRDKFVEHTEAMQNETLFPDLRDMEASFPILLDMELFKQALGGHLTSGRMALDVISQFTEECHIFKAIGSLLPSLIKFYQWLHTDLAYMVTRAQAGTITIEKMVLHASTWYSEQLGQHYVGLHKKVEEGYNRFINEVSSTVRYGGCGTQNSIERISKETPLLHFLSDQKEEGQGNDCLFIVIDDMIHRHNKFLNYVRTTVYDNEGYELIKRYIPEELLFLYPRAVSNDTMIVSETSKGLLEVVQSRYFMREFDFLKIQEDVVISFIAGKPKVEDPSKFLRVAYRFKEVKQMPEKTIQPFEGMLDLPENFPESFMEELPDDQKRLLELTFHSADYNGLLQVALGLKIIADQLSQANSIVNLTQEIIPQTLPELMTLLIYDEQRQRPTKELFEHITVQTENAQTDSLTPDQYYSLEAIPAKCLYSTLKKFIQWIRDKVYDFHALPLTMKRSMSMEDEEFIMSSDQHYHGPPRDLQEKISNVEREIAHSEDHFRTHLKELSKESIIVILSDLSLVDDTEKAFIPQTVLVEQYVPLRICIRRLSTKLEKVAIYQQQSLEVQQEWSEFIYDLWADEQTDVCQREIQSSDEQTDVCERDIQSSDEQTDVCEREIQSSDEQTDVCEREIQSSDEQTDVCERDIQSSDEQTDVCEKEIQSSDEQTDVCEREIQSSDEQTESEGLMAIQRERERGVRDDQKFLSSGYQVDGVGRGRGGYRVGGVGRGRDGYRVGGVGRGRDGYRVGGRGRGRGSSNMYESS